VDDRWQAVAAVLRQEKAEPADLLAALAVVQGLRADLDRVERRLIGTARESGASWSEVANVLGLRSRQAAEQRWLRLGQAASRDATAARKQRERQRIADAAAGAEVVHLRAAVWALFEHLAALPGGGELGPAATLAVATLEAALQANPGALFDLARLAVGDLATLPEQSLGGPVADAVNSVRALAGPHRS
jgi:hypothetical protein